MSEQHNKEEMRVEVEAVLDEVRPFLDAHGGGVQLIDVDEEGNVTLQVQGACKGCPMASMTFGLGVEKKLREQVEGIKEIRYT